MEALGRGGLCIDSQGCFAFEPKCDQSTKRLLRIVFCHVRLFYDQMFAHIESGNIDALIRI